MAKQIQVVVDCADPGRLARFWAEVLGYQVEDLPPGGWAAAVDPDGVGPRLLFQAVPEPKITKNRLHLDVRTAERGTPIEVRRPLVHAEVARVTALGATHVHTFEEQPDYFALMNDPEGHEFCVC